MIQRNVELRIVDYSGDLWSLTVDGVIYAQSRNKSHLSMLADKVRQLNKGFEFNVVD